MQLGLTPVQGIFHGLPNPTILSPPLPRHEPGLITNRLPHNHWSKYPAGTEYAEASPSNSQPFFNGPTSTMPHQQGLGKEAFRHVNIRDKLH